MLVYFDIEYYDIKIMGAINSFNIRGFKMQRVNGRNKLIIF